VVIDESKGVGKLIILDRKNLLDAFLWSQLRVLALYSVFVQISGKN
jgi:hypothetical protein